MRPRPILCSVLVAGVLPVAGCSDAESPVATGPLRPSTKSQTYEFARFDRGVTPVIERTLDVSGRVARRN